MVPTFCIHKRAIANAPTFEHHPVRRQWSQPNTLTADTRNHPGRRNDPRHGVEGYLITFARNDVVDTSAIGVASTHCYMRESRIGVNFGAACRKKLGVVEIMVTR